MPAAFTHFLNGCCAIERRKPLKISPSPRSPQYFRASSLIGNVASVSVFSVHRRMQWPPSGLRSILSHRSCNRSLSRSPVNSPNIDACLRIGTSHSVASRIFISSSVRYSFFTSCHLMPSRKSLTFSVIYFSLYAIFSRQRNVDQ